MVMNLIQVGIFRAFHSMKPPFFYNNGPAIWHGFPDITHIKVNDGCKSTILNLILVEIFQGMSLSEITHFVL